MPKINDCYSEHYLVSRGSLPKTQSIPELGCLMCLQTFSIDTIFNIMYLHSLQFFKKNIKN